MMTKTLHDASEDLPSAYHTGARIGSGIRTWTSEALRSIPYTIFGLEEDMVNVVPILWFMWFLQGSKPP